MGMKKIKGNGHAPKLSKGTPFGGKNNQEHEEFYFKNETIEDWNCHPDCPVDMFPNAGGGNHRYNKQTTSRWFGSNEPKKALTIGKEIGIGDSGSAARFFYCAKASKSERNMGCENLEPEKRDLSRKEGNPGGDNPRNRGVKKVTNSHTTVKPLALIKYLCKLTMTPTGGIVLDPFLGSGTTAIACEDLEREWVGIEIEEEYCEIAKARIKIIADKHKQVNTFFE